VVVVDLETASFFPVGCEVAGSISFPSLKSTVYSVAVRLLQGGDIADGEQDKHGQGGNCLHDVCGRVG
jgi:hypothetical protein